MYQTDHAMSGVLQLGLQVEPGNILLQQSCARVTERMQSEAEGKTGYFVINGGPPIAGTVDHALLQTLQSFGTGTMRTTRTLEAGEELSLVCGLYPSSMSKVDLPPHSEGSVMQVDTQPTGSGNVNMEAQLGGTSRIEKDEPDAMV